MWRSKWFGFVVAAAILVGAAASWALRSTHEVKVSMAHITTGSITRRVVATGTVEAVTTVQLGSQVSGTVQTLDADYNSLVHAGQVVARLDPSLYEAQLQEVKAAFAEAQADVVNARAMVVSASVQLEGANQILTRTRQLAARELVTQSDLDAAVIAVNSAEADRRSADARLTSSQAAVVEAKATVDQAQVNLDHTVIRSPIDGIVLQRGVDVGQTLAAAVQSPELFIIASDLSRVQLEVAVDESDVAGLGAGAMVTFDVESYPNETFHGTVTQVRLQPVAEQTTTATTVGTSTTPAAQSTVATFVSYSVIVGVDNPDRRLRPGMTTEVTLRGARREHAVRIPNAALAFRPPQEVLTALGETTSPSSTAASTGGKDVRETRLVWLYDGKRLTAVTVQTGLSDDGWTELLSGKLASGEDVVTSAVLQRHSRL